MPPPGWRAREPDQAGGLGRHAVGGHQLLLLAHRVEEAERVRAEADQPQRGEAGQRQRCRHQHGAPLPPPARGEHHEREYDAGGDLHAHADDHRDRALAQAAAAGAGSRRRGCRLRRRVRHAGATGRASNRRRSAAGPRLTARGQRQCRRQRGHHEGVVVGPADGQLEQHGVQAHECHRPLPLAPQCVGGVADQCDRPEAGERGDRLQRPQAAGQPERRERVAPEREQGAVGGVLEGPPHEREDRVPGRFGRDVRIGVQAMQGPEAGVAEVPEHVLGDQRRPEQQDDVRGQDGPHQRPRRQRPGAREHDQVAGAHDQVQGLEAVAAERGGEAAERPRQPRRPAPGAGGDVLGGCTGRARTQQQHAREDSQQPDRAQHPGPARGAHRSRRAAIPPAAAGDARRRYRGGRLQGVHSAPYPGAAGSYAHAKVPFKQPDP